MFRFKKHKITYCVRNRITIRHAYFEFSTLRTVGGVGFFRHETVVNSAFSLLNVEYGPQYFDLRNIKYLIVKGIV